MDLGYSFKERRGEYIVRPPLSRQQIEEILQVSKQYAMARRSTFLLVLSYY